METLVLDPKESRTSASARILIADDQPDVVRPFASCSKGKATKPKE